MNSNIWFSVWRIAIVIATGLIILLILHFSLKAIEKRVNKVHTGKERARRLTTLIRAGNSVGTILVIFLSTLMILNELGISIAPILASAGVVGLAFSLGAQMVIKDFLAGIVILSENLFTIGDIITVGSTTGTVEDITLRATHLRDADGKLNIIPNGDIRSVANLTTKWAQVIITLNFDYDVVMDQVLRILNESVEKIQNDKETSSSIMETPSILGSTGFTDWAVQAQIIAKTSLGKQWFVARLLRKNVLADLKANGVQIATPRGRYEQIV